MHKLLMGLGLLCAAGIGSAIVGQTASPVLALYVLTCTAGGLFNLYQFFTKYEAQP